MVISKIFILESESFDCRHSTSSCIVIVRTPYKGAKTMDRSDEDDDLRVLEDTEPVLERAPQYSPTVMIGSASSSLEILSKVPDTRSSSEEFDKGMGMPALGVDWSDDGCEMFPAPSTAGPGLASREEGVAKWVIWSRKGVRCKETASAM